MEIDSIISINKLYNLLNNFIKENIIAENEIKELISSIDCLYKINKYIDEKTIYKIIVRLIYLFDNKEISFIENIVINKIINSLSKYTKFYNPIINLLTPSILEYIFKYIDSKKITKFIIKVITNNKKDIKEFTTLLGTKFSFHLLDKYELKLINYFLNKYK